VTDFAPFVANPVSKHKTAASLRIELHYAKLGIIARWDWERYTRLAAFLDLTVYELASHICWAHKAVDVARQANRFPGPVCLLLTLLEAQAMHKFSDDIVADPFNHGPPKDL
jgi:hypothetical protein